VTWVEGGERKRRKSPIIGQAKRIDECSNDWATEEFEIFTDGNLQSNRRTKIRKKETRKEK
jgi:hypothetical protein